MLTALDGGRERLIGLGVAYGATDLRAIVSVCAWFHPPRPTDGSLAEALAPAGPARAPAAESPGCDSPAGRVPGYMSEAWTLDTLDRQVVVLVNVMDDLTSDGDVTRAVEQALCD